MVIKLKRSTAVVVLITAAGMLIGMAIGQVRDAVSSPDQPASASYVSPLERNVKAMSRDLHSIKTTLGETAGYITILKEIQGIKDNTYETCKEVATYSCSP